MLGLHRPGLFAGLHPGALFREKPMGPVTDPIMNLSATSKTSGLIAWLEPQMSRVA